MHDKSSEGVSSRYCGLVCSSRGNLHKMLRMSNKPSSYATICDKQGGHAGGGKLARQEIVRNPSQEEEIPLAHISIKD